MQSENERQRKKIDREHSSVSTEELFSLITEANSWIHSNYVPDCIYHVTLRMFPWNWSPLYNQAHVVKTICFDECKFYCWVGRDGEINKVLDFGFRKSPGWEYVINKSLPEKWFARSSYLSTWAMKMTEKATAILVPIAMQCEGSVRSVCRRIWIIFLLRSAALSLPNLK